MTKTQIIIANLKKASVAKLCDLWEETEKQEMSQELADVRGWLMAALESKNAAAFAKWIDSCDDSPRAHFC